MNEPEIKRVFAYLRVSGKGQLDGDGFDRQISIIQEYCNKQGWIIARVFREKAVSGTVEAVDRPELAKAMALCGGANGIDTVVVERSDRIARDLLVNELFYREARERGIKVIEAASGTVLSTEDDTDPTKTMIRQMLAVMAQWEKATIVKKLRMARERIRNTGARCEGAKPKPLPAKVQPYWSRINVLYHVENRSVADVCRWLNTKTQKRWPRSSVHYWLTRVHYKYEPTKSDALITDNIQDELAAVVVQGAATCAGNEPTGGTPEGCGEGAPVSA